MPYFTDARTLEAVRRRDRTGPRPRARSAFPVLQQPDLQRGTYAKRLRLEYVREAEKLLNEKLVQLLHQLAEDYRRQQEAEERGDAWRTDAARQEDVRDVFRDIARDFFAKMPNAKVAELARTTAWETSTFQRAQLRAAFRSQLSVDLDELFKEERGLRSAVDDFTVENVALIRTVSSSYFAQVEDLVLSAVSKGMRPERLAKLIAERAGVAESNAERIARDQVGKFYGKLNGTRQQALGVKRYRWRTMRDNRVRAEHQHRNGDVFSWDNPPADGHPGHPINCRCWAEPIIDDVLAEELTTTEGDKPGAGTSETEGWQRLGRSRTPREPRAQRVPRVPRAPRAPPAPALPHGPVRGDGAAHVLDRHPKLAELLGDKLRVDGATSYDVREQVRDLAELPDALLEHMRPLLGDVHIGTRPVTDLGRSGATARLRGVQPRGYAEGAAWDTVAGLYEPNTLEVLVSTTYTPPGAVSVALHEFGHAVDGLAMGPGQSASRQPEFQAAWREFTSGNYTYSRRPYFNQPWPAGTEETFAEAFAHYYKWGESAALVAFGPKVVDYLRRHYGRETWARAPKLGRTET